MSLPVSVALRQKAKRRAGGYGSQTAAIATAADIRTTLAAHQANNELYASDTPIDAARLGLAERSK